MTTEKKTNQRARRHARIRNRVSGTIERPRLSVFRSSQHIYAQIIDDETGKTLAAVSTVTKAIQAATTTATKTEAARKVGEAIAKVCLEKGLSKVVFDRGGYKYHGRISALAESARKAGLLF